MPDNHFTFNITATPDLCVVKGIEGILFYPSNTYNTLFLTLTILYFSPFKNNLIIDG